MPQRITVRRVPTSEVQGEGSWVEVRAVTVGDIMNVYERQEEQSKATYRLGSFLARVFALFKRKTTSRSQIYRDFCYGIIKQVSAWNWVDADGNPLPQPTESPRVVELLTDPEVVCLMQAVYGSGDEETVKN